MTISEMRMIKQINSVEEKDLRILSILVSPGQTGHGLTEPRQQRNRIGVKAY